MASQKEKWRKKEGNRLIQQYPTRVECADPAWYAWDDTSEKCQQEVVYEDDYDENA
jgi:hypothetical protein